MTFLHGLLVGMLVVHFESVFQFSRLQCALLIAIKSLNGYWRIAFFSFFPIVCVCVQINWDKKSMKNKCQKLSYKP